MIPSWTGEASVPGLALFPTHSHLVWILSFSSVIPLSLHQWFSIFASNLDSEGKEPALWEGEKPTSHWSFQARWDLAKQKHYFFFSSDSKEAVVCLNPWLNVVMSWKRMRNLKFNWNKAVGLEVILMCDLYAWIQPIRKLKWLEIILRGAGNSCFPPSCCWSFSTDPSEYSLPFS